VVEALGLKNPILVGHSMGGMIAAEMAAVAPHDVSRLGLIASAGLWLDAWPIPDLFAALPYEFPPLLFHDAALGASLMTAGVAFDDPEWLKGFLVANARQLGMAGRILFPIPERGLSDRLYRITARTLLVWGDSDRLISPVYAQAFKKAIAQSELVVIPEAGHLLNLEKPNETAAALARLAE
jgi:pimeloyl-ACP methyl ester carboxylesterase